MLLMLAIAMHSSLLLSMMSQELEQTAAESVNVQSGETDDEIFDNYRKLLNDGSPEQIKDFLDTYKDRQIKYMSLADRLLTDAIFSLTWENNRSIIHLYTAFILIALQKGGSLQKYSFEALKNILNLTAKDRIELVLLSLLKKYKVDLDAIIKFSEEQASELLKSLCLSNPALIALISDLNIFIPEDAKQIVAETAQQYKTINPDYMIHVDEAVQRDNDLLENEEFLKDTVSKEREKINEISQIISYGSASQIRNLIEEHKEEVSNGSSFATKVLSDSIRDLIAKEDSSIIPFMVALEEGAEPSDQDLEAIIHMQAEDYIELALVMLLKQYNKLDVQKASSLLKDLCNLDSNYYNPYLLTTLHLWCGVPISESDKPIVLPALKKHMEMLKQERLVAMPLLKVISTLRTWRAQIEKSKLQKETLSEGAQKGSTSQTEAFLHTWFKARGFDKLPPEVIDKLPLEAMVKRMLEENYTLDGIQKGHLEEYEKATMVGIKDNEIEKYTDLVMAMINEEKRCLTIIAFTMPMLIHLRLFGILLIKLHSGFQRM